MSLPTTGGAHVPGGGDRSLGETAPRISRSGHGRSRSRSRRRRRAPIRQARCRAARQVRRRRGRPPRPCEEPFGSAPTGARGALRSWSPVLFASQRCLEIQLAVLGQPPPIETGLIDEDELQLEPLILPDLCLPALIHLCGVRLQDLVRLSERDEYHPAIRQPAWPAFFPELEIRPLDSREVDLQALVLRRGRNGVRLDQELRPRLAAHIGGRITQGPEARR